MILMMVMIVSVVSEKMNVRVNRLIFSIKVSSLLRKFGVGWFEFVN